jgi:hypothetical protein
MNEETHDPEEIESAPKQPEASFIKAMMGTDFAGETLKPWTPERKIAAQSMGMLYPLIGDEGVEQMERTGVYPGALKDTIIFVWLCTQKESVVRRAFRKPIEAMEDAIAWASSRGLIDIDAPEFEEAYLLFSQKMEEEMKARSKPDKKESKAQPSATDPNVSCGLPNGQSI